MRSHDMVPDAILHLYFVLPVVREVVRHEGDEAKLASACEGKQDDHTQATESTSRRS